MGIRIVLTLFVSALAYDAVRNNEEEVLSLVVGKGFKARLPAIVIGSLFTLAYLTLMAMIWIL